MHWCALALPISLMSPTIPGKRSCSKSKLHCLIGFQTIRSTLEGRKDRVTRAWWRRPPHYSAGLFNIGLLLGCEPHSCVDSRLRLQHLTGGSRSNGKGGQGQRSVSWASQLQNSEAPFAGECDFAPLSGFVAEASRSGFCGWRPNRIGRTEPKGIDEQCGE